MSSKLVRFFNTLRYACTPETIRVQVRQFVDAPTREEAARGLSRLLLCAKYSGSGAFIAIAEEASEIRLEMMASTHLSPRQQVRYIRCCVADTAHGLLRSPTTLDYGAAQFDALCERYRDDDYRNFLPLTAMEVGYGRVNRRHTADVAPDMTCSAPSL